MVLELPHGGFPFGATPLVSATWNQSPAARIVRQMNGYRVDRTPECLWLAFWHFTTQGHRLKCEQH